MVISGNRNTPYYHALFVYNQRVKCERGKCGIKLKKNNFSFNEFGFGSKQMESCTSLHKFICFIESIDTAALGGRFDFAGGWIRLR